MSDAAFIKEATEALLVEILDDDCDDLQSVRAIARTLRAAGQVRPEPPAFQQRVQPWMMACFGPEISSDTVERNHRFLEESLELVQSTGCTADEAHQLVDYVYGRPAGEPKQEVGGVMVTLAALCLAQGLDMHAAGETELARIWTKVDVIRAKQAAKPKHSPLPIEVGVTVERNPEPLPAKLIQRLKVECDKHGMDIVYFAWRIQVPSEFTADELHAMWDASLNQPSPLVKAEALALLADDETRKLVEMHVGRALSAAQDRLDTAFEEEFDLLPEDAKQLCDTFYRSLRKRLGHPVEAAIERPAAASHRPASSGPLRGQ